MFYRKWFIALFLFGSLLANASTDITTAKGIDQPVITQLTPQPGSTVSIDTAIEVQFSLDLDPASVQTNNVKLRCLSCDNQGVIQEDASYVAGDRRVVFSHPEPLEVGIYEVEYKSLKPTKANKDIKIGEIKYRFEVTAYIPDTTPPLITLNGTNPLQLFTGQPYDEKGATATDETDGNISVEIDGTVDTSTAGNYTVTYSATDTSGNQSQTTRTVTVIAPQLLSLKLKTNATSLNLGEKASLTLIGSYEDNSEKELTGQVEEWIIAPSGAVEINATSLTALKDTNVTVQAKIGTVVSNILNLDIYWEVDGYRLPPEPDPAVNNATLLGIDVNNNGVRDDVERYIYKTYDTYTPCHQVPDGNYTLPSGEIIPLAKEVCEESPIPYHPIVRAIAMQGARAAQIIIQEPEKARERLPVWDDAIQCALVLDEMSSTKEALYFPEYIFGDLFKKIQFNTVKRARAFAKFNFYLSGGVYRSPTNEEQLGQCSDEVKELYKGL